jgi:serine/threonine protein kinase
MEYIEGEDLEEKLRKAGGPLPEAKVLPWTGQILDALAYLHRQNPHIIHRDIKPANIRITPKGQAILVDFGPASATRRFGQHLPIRGRDGRHSIPRRIRRSCKERSNSDDLE